MREHRTAPERARGSAPDDPGATSRAGDAGSPNTVERKENDLAAGSRVLRMEATALEGLAHALDGGFVKALDLLENVRGRVVVTGMGKSGHIARKIASTFASTGTPALFVHPAEASHGDLGMIARDDAIVALSNSGETNELSDLVNFARRFDIPLIAITAGRQSTLAEAANVALILPPAPEACTLGLAPTTSTTVMLGLGDALAIALLERRGFSSDEFQVLHPGGSIGRRLLRVSDIMHVGDAMPLTRTDTAMSEAILVITAKHFGCVGVVDDAGRLIGIVTDGDLRRHMGNGLLDRAVGDVMTSGPQTIRPRALAAEALNVMNSRGITSLFVLEEGRPLGILHIHDCLRAGVG